MTDLPPLTYLMVDSVAEGVGLSQVVPYVERLVQRGMDVTLHSFEKDGPNEGLRRRLDAAGVRWRPQRFRAGAAAGMLRVVEGAAAVAGAQLVHARSDLPAASCIVSRRPAWVWDMRGFWWEERRAAGLLRPGSPQDRVMRAIEAAAARRSSAIVTLAEAAVDVLAQRYGQEVVSKSRVITTGVDLERFDVSPLPRVDPLRLLLAGSLSRLYDVPGALRLVRRVRARRPAELTVLTPDPGPWGARFREFGAAVARADPSEMPARVADHHVGLSLRRFGAGYSSYAATPTKLGEFLASGRPVVVSPGLGDMDALLAKHDCGVVVDDLSTGGLDRAADEIDRLVLDPGTPSRCRALAEANFNLDRGVDQLLLTYRDALR